MKKITLLFMATIFTVAMFLGFAPTTTYADTSYHAYMGIQSNTKAWIFRNPYDDAKYGFGTKAFKGLNAITGKTLTAYTGTFTDASLTSDGTYTVTLDKPDFTTEKTLSQLFVSTDIPACDSVKVTDVIVAINGKPIYTFDDAAINPESKAYIQIMCINIWNKDVKDKISVSLPITKCEITFTISGLADAASTQTALKGFEFKEYKDHVVVLSYTGSNDVITIPSSVNGKDVTEIGANAFNNKDLSITKVTIPNTVTKIGKNAFYGCSKLTSITLPSSVTTISGGAFSGCSKLTKLALSKSVATIGKDAFASCDTLTIYAPSNSIAYKYAVKHKIKVKKAD